VRRRQIVDAAYRCFAGRAATTMRNIYRGDLQRAPSSPSGGRDHRASFDLDLGRSRTFSPRRGAGPLGALVDLVGFFFGGSRRRPGSRGRVNVQGWGGRGRPTSTRALGRRWALGRSWRWSAGAEAASSIGSRRRRSARSPVPLLRAGATGRSTRTRLGRYSAAAKVLLRSAAPTETASARQTQAKSRRGTPMVRPIQRQPGSTLRRGLRRGSKRRVAFHGCSTRSRRWRRRHRPAPGP
jgi:hypothetical protein